MFESLRKIGMMECTKLGNTPEQIILENNVKNSRINNVIELHIDDKENNTNIEVKIAPLDTNNLSKYGAYQKNTNGVNILYYEIVSKKDFQRKKDKAESEKICDLIRTKFINVEIDHPIKEILTNNKEDIIQKLLAFKEELDKETKYLLTLVYNGHYVYEIDEFKNKIKEMTSKKNYSKSKEESRYKGNCVFCHEQKDLVGLLNLDDRFMFFNYGVPIFARGFSIANAYKDTAICNECAEYINLGSRIIAQSTNTVFNIIKKSNKTDIVSYIVVPRFLSPSENEIDTAYEKTIKAYLEERKNMDGQKNKVTGKDIILGNLEDRIAQQKNVMSFDFIYYSSNQRKININYQIREVFPSRLNSLIQIARDVQDDHQTRCKTNNYTFKPLSELKKLVSNYIVVNKDKSAKEIKQSDNWYNEYFDIQNALYTGMRYNYNSFIKLLNRYMQSIIEKYDIIEYPFRAFNTGFDLYLYLLKTKTITNKEKKMDYSKTKEEFKKWHGISMPETSSNNEKFVEYMKKLDSITDQFFNYWENYSDMYKNELDIFTFCMGNLAYQVRYARRQKGSFIDDWLSNISTNMRKMDYLLSRSIESLTIENCLDKPFVKIPLALASFFSDKCNKDDISAIGYEYIFPFVSGFMFRTEADEEQLVEEPESEEEQQILEENN